MVRPDLRGKVRQSLSNVTQSKLTHALHLTVVNYSVFMKSMPLVVLKTHYTLSSNSGSAFNKQLPYLSIFFAH